LRRAMVCVVAVLCVAGAISLAGEIVWQTDFGQGEYKLELHEENMVRWVWLPLDEPLNDFQFGASARFGIGSQDIEWGLIWGIDNDNYYIFWIRPDGKFTLSRQGYGSWMKRDCWERNRHINKGTEANHLKVRFVGDEMRLFVNDELIYERRTAEEGPWRCGLVVGTGRKGAAVALFSWAEVEKL